MILKRLPSHLKISLIMLGLSMAVMYAPKLTEFVLSSTTRFVLTKENLYTADITDLPTGHYILSLGKTRAICDVQTNRKSIYKHNGIAGTKRNISDDFSFYKESHDFHITLDCTHSLKGFPPRLTHKPILLSYTKGRILEVIRYSVDVLLGAFASGFLLVMIAYLTTSNNKWMTGLFGLACAAVFYSMNQSYIFRTFFEGDINSWLHPISKAIFTWVLFKALSEEWKLKWVDSIVLGIPVIALSLAYPDHTKINQIYKYCHILWLVQFSYLYWKSISTSRSELSKALMLLWSFALALDVTTLTNAFGPYFAPVFFSLLVFGLTVESGAIAKRNQWLYSSSQELAKITTKANSTTLEVLDIFASSLSKISGFAGYSVYVDSALLGGTDKYQQQYQRTGHGGLTSKNAPETIDIFVGEGQSIIKSIKSQNFVFQKGSRDNCWYAIVPLGSNAAICLSASLTQREPDSSYFNSLMDAIRSSIQTLDIRLKEQATSLNSSLARLKKTIKNGSYAISSGAIFIDVADYSKHCENFGISYAEFISSTLFPALIKTMDGFATPESVRGDEIYFVVAKELCEQDDDIHTLTCNAIMQLHSFIKNEANKISIENGFPTFEYRLGATVGEGNLVIDDVQVRTSGEHINRAKRLQDSASKGEILTDVSLVERSKGQFFAITKKSIIVKKNQIEAARVGIKRAA